MNAAAFLSLFLLIPLVCFAPGFLLVRRMHRWDPLEKLAASLGASILLVYLAAFAIYNTMVSWRLTWVFTALSALALFVCRQDARRLFAVPQVRRVSLLFGALFAWNLLMLAVIRNYIGGLWGPDWYQHYERALFFVQRVPDMQPFFDHYLLPARPPLMNLFSAFFLAQTGTAFANFQITFAFLNLLPFVPLVLVSRLLVRGATRTAGLLAALLACNPMFMHNAQFTWTKAGSAFFIVLALWFYLVGWRRDDPVRMSIAFLSLSAATLVHYSGGPYVVVLGLHYVIWVFWSRRQRWRELAGLALASAALLATWFAYSVSAYGLQETFAGNTSVVEAERMTVTGNIAKIGGNIIDTLVPPMARQYWLDRTDDTFRRLVDNAFYLYQVNLPFALGVTGGFVVLLLIVRAISRGASGRSARERRFWLLFVVAATVFSVAVVGPREHYGVAHIGLQPLVHVGVAFLAASLPTMSRTLRGVVLAGMAVDFVFGIAMHVFMEASLADWAVDYNLEVKNMYALRFVGDWMPALTLPLQWVSWTLFAALLIWCYRRVDRLPDVDTWTGRPRGEAGAQVIPA